MMSGRESCIWCGEDWPKFYKHKPYCVQCASACKKECRTCHKPYPELRFFKDGADRCNTCETRREREQMKKTGGLKLQVADSLLPFRSMSPSSDGESVDGFEPKLSSSEKKTNNKRKTRRRIESETEEEAAAEVGEEEDDDGGSNAGDYMDVESDCNKRVGSEKSGETRDDDDDDDGEVTRRNKKSKKVKNATETLLDYINVGHKKGKKKEVSFELAIKKKKRKSNKKLNGLTGEEANLIEENVVCSLMDYRRAFPGRATVQFFFMNGK